MMPTHGYGRFRSLLLGSVTAKVLHDARCAVWTAAHAERQQAPVLPRTVLCAVDGSPETASVLAWARTFCQRMDAALSVIHVVAPVSDWIALDSERALQEGVRSRAHDKVAALVASAGVDAPLRVAVGAIVGTVVEEAGRRAHT